jgi:hypothetical protein
VGGEPLYAHPQQDGEESPPAFLQRSSLSPWSVRLPGLV